MVEGSALVSVEQSRFSPIDYALQYNIFATTTPESKRLEQANCFDNLGSRSITVWAIVYKWSKQGGSLYPQTGSTTSSFNNVSHKQAGQNAKVPS